MLTRRSVLSAMAVASCLAFHLGRRSGLRDAPAAQPPPPIASHPERSPDCCNPFAQKLRNMTEIMEQLMLTESADGEASPTDLDR